MNKKIIYKIILAAFTLFIAWVLFSSYGKLFVEKEALLSAQKEEIVSVNRAGSLPTNASKKSKLESEFNATISKVNAEIHITFIAGDKVFSAAVSQGKTTYDAMALLASTAPFSFKAKYYSGLGYFIEEINGVKNSNGAYWTLYINGKYSTVGASQYVLKDKDNVEWKFEKR